jgi:hypothetical protein
MTTNAAPVGTGEVGFDRPAGIAALAAALSSVVFTVASVFLENALIAGLFMLLGGLLLVPLLVGLYERLRLGGEGLALTALLFGVGGSLGSVVRGGYLLASEISGSGSSSLSDAVDPRGLLTFGLTAIAVLLLSLLVMRFEDLPQMLAFVGVLLSLLLIALYVLHLVFAGDSSAVTIPSAVTGLVVAPAWYAWTGATLLRFAREEAGLAPAEELDDEPLDDAVDA